MRALVIAIALLGITACGEEESAPAPRAPGAPGGRAPAPKGKGRDLKPMRRIEGHLELDDVVFAYGAEPVVKGIAIDVPVGGCVALVGESGGGKSTTAKLIARFYDPRSGAVRVDGTDLRDVQLRTYRRQLGVVLQDPFLFSGTIGSNLRYGDEEATDEALWKALDIAQARSFVEEMPDRLESPIAQGGANVSGGQRQRLSIARALVKRPEIYIFDDSFSALDFRTDSLLRAALRRELGSATVIIVGQRVGTIMHADRIVVMEDGEVVGIGTHAELLETCVTYREIVLSQLTEEEAA